MVRVLTVGLGFEAGLFVLFLRACKKSIQLHVVG